MPSVRWGGCCTGEYESIHLVHMYYMLCIINTERPRERLAVIPFVHMYYYYAINHQALASV